MLYTRDVEIVLERVLNLMAKREEQGHPLSQNHIAGSLGVSAATVSNFLNRKEVGDVEKLAGMLRNYVDRESAKEDGGLLKVPFAETRQAKRLIDLVKYCHRYGRMGAAIGEPGMGKSTTIKELIRRDPSILLLEAHNRLGAQGALQDLCDSVKVPTTGLGRALVKRLRHKLTDKGRCIIVDDAHTLGFQALDILRTVYDLTGTGIVLVGISKLRRFLTGTTEEYEQLASRVGSRLWELPEFTLDDVRLLLNGVMRETEVEKAMKLVQQDPRSISSGRWLGDLLEDAGKFARKRKRSITLQDVQDAMEVAA